MYDKSQSTSFYLPEQHSHHRNYYHCHSLLLCAGGPPRGRADLRAGEVQGDQRGARADFRRDVRILERARFDSEGISGRVQEATKESTLPT